MFGDRDLQSQLAGALRELADDAAAVAFLEIILPLIDVLLPLGERRVDQPGELVRCGRDGLGLVHAGAHSAEVGAQGGLAGAQCGGGHAQGLGGTIGAAAGAPAQELAAGDPRAGAQAQPGSEVFEARALYENHDRVRVFYTAGYRRKDGTEVSLAFDVLYLLQRRSGGPKIFGFIAGDELAAYKQHGLVDEAGQPA
jgi:hypothetical protein